MRSLSGFVAVVAVAGLLLPGLAAAAVGSPPGAIRPLGTAFVNITATTSIAFAPSQVTVPPGENIQFTITQAANFDHSFVLSSLPNFTFDPSASASNLTEFFRAHAPLVNLSLGTTVGAKQSATIAPLAIGSYEFVCIVTGHFQSGMHGELLVSTASSGSGSGGGLALSPFLLGALAVVAVVVVVGIVAGVVMMRRRPRPPTPPGAPPASR